MNLEYQALARRYTTESNQLRYGGTPEEAAAVREAWKALFVAKRYNPEAAVAALDRSEELRHARSNAKAQRRKEQKMERETEINRLLSIVHRTRGAEVYLKACQDRGDGPNAFERAWLDSQMNKRTAAAERLRELGRKSMPTGVLRTEAGDFLA